MKIEIFIAASGGVVQGVRATKPKIAGATYREELEFDCRLVDYDDYDTDGCDAPYPGTVEDFERTKLDGRTWAEIEQISEAVL